MKRIALLALMLLCFAAVGCRPGQPIMNFVDQPIPATVDARSLSDSQVRSAIIKGGAERGWTMSDEGPGLLRASIEVRGKHQAVVRIPYSAKGYSITYVSSMNLEQEGNNIHPSYNSWVNYLNQSIQKYLVLE